MAYSVDWIGGFNPFEWPDMKCPVCGKSEFISTSHCSISCECCNVNFQIRSTAGDPGCVVDCYTKGAYAPAFTCPDCLCKFASFDKSPVCPESCGYTGNASIEDGIMRQYKLPEDFPDRYCLILKLGDYCSSWSALHDSVEFYGAGYSAYCKKYNRDYPTQKEWEMYQETLNPTYRNKLTIYS